VVPLAFSVPLGVQSDRRNRVRLSRLGALVWGLTAIATGLAPVVFVLILARIAGGSGQLVNEVAHPSLLSDYYKPEALPPVFSFYRAGSAGLALVAGVLAGGLGALIGWRATFVVLAIPTFVMVALMVRLVEPPRGHSDSFADSGPKFVESFSALRQVRSLRRTWLGAVLFGAGTIPFATYLSLFFDNVFHLGPFDRGAITSLFGVFGLVGFVVGGKLSLDQVKVDKPERLAAVTGYLIISFGVGVWLMALAPTVLLAILAVCFLSIGAVGFLPSYQTMVAMVVPSRIRSQAFAWSLLFYGFGAVVFTPIIGVISDRQGNRTALTILAILTALGGTVGVSSVKYVAADIERIAD
jgi:predicted MFS family arabinose efflux permease